MASNSKWVACGSRRTLALESTDDVDADGSNSTWAVRVDRKVRRTFVHIPAASLWVTSATRVTLALRSCRRDGTCRILATLNPSTRIFARVAFHYVRRKTLTLPTNAVFV